MGGSVEVDFRERGWKIITAITAKNYFWGRHCIPDLPAPFWQYWGASSLHV